MKRWRWIVVVLVLAMVGFAALILRPRDFTFEDVQKLRPGMTQAQITETLRQPPAHEVKLSSEMFDEDDLDELLASFPTRPDRLVMWESKTASVQVCFAGDLAIDMSGSGRGSESLWSKMRRWAQLDF